MSGFTTSKTTAVLLAAGAGTRLGRGPKALLPFRGRPLVQVLAGVLLEGGCREVVVVLGAAADDVLATTGLGNAPGDGVRVLVNHEWHTGMAGSFVAGVDNAAPADNVLVALVDQPGITADVVKALLASHSPGRVTAAAYPDASGTLRRGHPLLLDASLRAQATGSAEGDFGARLFLQANPALIDLVDCSYARGEDLDRPDQLHLLH